MNWYSIFAGHFGFPQPEDDILLRGTFDYSGACESCCIGRKQTGPIRFAKEPKIGNKAFTGLNWIDDEIFITDAARRIFDEEGISGLNYSRPVLHKSGEPLEHWWQMHPVTLLPPAIKLDGLETETCELPTDESTLRVMRKNNPEGLTGPFCGQIKYHPPVDEKWVSHYEVDAVVLDRRNDVVRTCEWFGSGGKAFRNILANQRVKDLCNRYKLRGLFFEQVKLI